MSSLKGFLRVMIIGIVILGFICIDVLFYNTCCLADITLNPYCTGDTDRIEELTVDFIEKYGEGVEIRRDADTGFLEKILCLNLSGPGDTKERAFSFLSENSSFLGINVNDLEFLSISSLEKVTFTQLYKGVPVHKGKMWVTVSKEGGSKSSVTLKDYYFCLDVDVVPTVTKEEAAVIVMNNMGVTELFNEEERFVSDWSNSAYIPYGAVIEGTSSGVYPGIASSIPLFPPPSIFFPQPRKISEKKPASTQLLVYPKGGDAYLCWEFEFNQGHQEYTWCYYIDAHTGEIIYNYRGENYTSTSSGTTSGNSSYNPYTSLNMVNSVGLSTGPYLGPTFSISNPALNYERYGNSLFSPSGNYFSPISFPSAGSWYGWPTGNYTYASRGNYGTLDGSGYGYPISGFGYGYPINGFGYIPYGNPYGRYLDIPYSGVYLGRPFNLFMGSTR